MTAALPAKYRHLQSHMQVDLVFSRPIFHWANVQGQFFSMVYDALKDKVQVSTSDFVVQNSAVLGEFRLRYNVLGGNSSITLSAERLSMVFPQVVPSNNDLVIQLVRAIHDAVPKALPEKDYERIEVQLYQHLEIVDSTRDKVLQRSLLFPKLGPRVVDLPGVRFTLVSEHENWRCIFTADPSALSATAIFVMASIELRSVPQDIPFTDLAGDIVRKCLTTLDLKPDNVHATG